MVSLFPSLFPTLNRLAAPVPVAPAAPVSAVPPAPPAPPPIKAPRLTAADLKAYIDAVDNNGNVNQNRIKAGGASTAEARTRIVAGYAGEFVTGGRANSATDNLAATQA